MWACRPCSMTLTRTAPSSLAAPSGPSPWGDASRPAPLGVHSTTTIQNFFGLGAEQSHKTETVLDADHPEVFAAEDNAITPIEYLLVGLASCLTAGVASVAQNRGIQLRSVESTIEGSHDIRGILGADTDVRNGFNDIKVTFAIDADASRQEIEALVAQSQKRSAVFDALTNPTEVTVAVA